MQSARKDWSILSRADQDSLHSALKLTDTPDPDNTGVDGQNQIPCADHNVTHALAVDSIPRDVR